MKYTLYDWLWLTGQTIKRERKGYGLTLKELSQRTGISIAYLSDIERGRTDPSLKTIRKLYRFFSPEHITVIENPPK